MTLAPWQILARAEVTKRLAHGDRYLETRVFLADGRVMQQTDPGLPEVDGGWREVGRFKDLDATLRQLRREGWEIRPPAAIGWRWRVGLLLAIGIAVAGVVVGYWLLTR